MTDIAATQSSKLDVGRVISDTFQVLGRNFVAFAALALILAGIPTAIIAYLQAGSMTANDIPNFDATYFGAIGWTVLASLITGAMLQGALVYGAVQDMNGVKASLGECLATGLRSFLPLIGLSILFTLAMAFGLVFFVVPGLMMLCAWCVAAPALVADRTGVFGAFNRSAELTRGNRWRIFALGVVSVIILAVINMVIGAISTAMTFATAGLDPVAIARNPIRIVLELISGTISAVLSSTGFAVLYVELRRLKDGAGPQWLAEIFS